MSDVQEDILLREDEPMPQAPRPQELNDQHFQLVKSYFDVQFHLLKKEILTDNGAKAEKVSRKLKEEVGVKFRYEGNKAQYFFNDEVVTEINKIPALTTNREILSIVKVVQDKLRRRNKLIRIADKSTAGWKTVKEYESDEVASDSEDEKKIRQAENRAIKSIKDKSRFAPYARNKTPAETAVRPNQLATNGSFQPDRNSTFPIQPFPAQFNLPPFRTNKRQPTPFDIYYSCRQYGHWKDKCPFKASASASSTSKPQQ